MLVVISNNYRLLATVSMLGFFLCIILSDPGTLHSINMLVVIINR